MSIGELRLIPAGVYVWSIALQDTICFKKDRIVKITNSVIGSNKYFFGQLQTLLFNHIGYIPCLIEDNNGDISVTNIDGTLPYKVPEPQFLDFKPHGTTGNENIN